MASRNETGDKGIEYLADALQANEVTCESFRSFDSLNSYRHLKSYDWLTIQFIIEEHGP